MPFFLVIVIVIVNYPTLAHTIAGGGAQMGAGGLSTPSPHSL